MNVTAYTHPSNTVRNMDNDELVRTIYNGTFPVSQETMEILASRLEQAVVLNDDERTLIDELRDQDAVLDTLAVVESFKAQGIPMHQVYGDQLADIQTGVYKHAIEFETVLALLPVADRLEYLWSSARYTGMNGPQGSVVGELKAYIDWRRDNIDNGERNDLAPTFRALENYRIHSEVLEATVGVLRLLQSVVDWDDNDNVHASVAKLSQFIQEEF